MAVARQAGHMDLKTPFVIWAVLAVIGVEAFYRYRDGRSLLGEHWLPIAVGAAVLLAVVVALVIGWRWRTRPRVERAGKRTFIRFDGERLEVVPGELETREWTSGGAFGQPLVEYMSISRGGAVIYQGRRRDAERLLAAFREASK